VVEFGRYYINFIRDLFSTIGEFFRGLFETFGKLFSSGFKELYEKFLLASLQFSLLDWVMFVIVTLVNLVFVGVIVIKLIHFLKKYVKFVKSELEKEDLVTEIAFLNQKTMELIDEKNKILALKVSNLGINPDQDEEQALEDESEVEDSGRFVKLTKVDQFYLNQNMTIVMDEKDMIKLDELVTRFINFSASRLKLYYNRKIISAFFAGMAASHTMILEGISGTGKTSLPYAMGKFFNHDAYIIPVQPSWRDRAEMLGYLNEFTKKFNETDFLKAVYDTTYREDINIIVLDEMNLARVEYYFAELLSLMEMPDADKWLIDITADTKPGDPKHLINGKILLPQNVWFVGTANKDDSTFIITDKVYDRATPIEINTKSEFIDAPLTDSITVSHHYLDQLFAKAHEDFPLSPYAMENLEKLDHFITKNFKVTFGNRIMKQIRAFVPVYVACGGTENEALDYMVARKIFRKFEGLNLPFLQDEINDLSKLITKLFGKDEFVECQEFLTRIKKTF
jgi:predicted transport protein